MEMTKTKLKYTKLNSNECKSNCGWGFSLNLDKNASRKNMKQHNWFKNW